MSDIFISYSRRDLDFAGRIADALAKYELDTWIDWKSIPRGEDWQQEIYRGIEEANIFLFLVSKDSVASWACNDEITHAINNGKRILPVFISGVGNEEVYVVAEKFLVEKNKREINRRNFIFCREGMDDFDRAIEEIQITIHMDYQWVKYHTELLVKALKWDEHKDNSRLLRGKELRQVVKELAEVSNQADPQPTQLQREYVLASQRSEVEQQRRFVIGLGLGFVVVIILSIFA